MPELGEVDLLATRLNAHLREMKTAPALISGEALHPRAAQMWTACADKLAGARLTRITRKGKYLLFEWAEDRGLLLAHLRMTGWWAWRALPQTLTVVQGYTLDRHPKLFLTFSRAGETKRSSVEEQLIYYDSRMLGEIAFFNVSNWREIVPLAAQAPDFIGTENSVAGGFLQDENEFLALARARQRATTRTIRDLLCSWIRARKASAPGWAII
jgi:formamidopyrimidine-DNA glycosylase